MLVFGIAIAYSSTPFQMPTFRLTLPVADGGRAAATLEVTNVHTLPPVDVRVGQWRSDLESLGRLVTGNGAGGQGSQLLRNQLLLGDFNATYDHSEFRKLLDGGPDGRKLVDIGTAPGRVSSPTWPMDGQALPGITIDHLITRPAFRRRATPCTASRERTMRPCWPR